VPVRSTYPWFRLYDELIDDPKVQRLPPYLFKTWINFMSLANRTSHTDGTLPPINDLAFKLRMTVAEAHMQRKELVNAGLVDEHNGVYFIHNWKGRQFVSDSSNERVRRHRDKKKRERNVSRNADVTVQRQIQRQKQKPDTETETLKPAAPVGEGPIEPEVVEEWKPGPAVQTGRPRDLAIDAFIEVLSVPYIITAADGVQLANMRKATSTPAYQKPPRWDEVVRHYVDSSLSKYSIADLCSRYSTFYDGPVDRFGRAKKLNAHERMIEKIMKGEV
jgi:hypothetical protein